MENLRQIGKGLLSIALNIALWGMSAVIFISIVSAVTGCQQQAEELVVKESPYPDPDPIVTVEAIKCEPITPNQVLEYIGEPFKMEHKWEYYRFVNTETNESTGWLHGFVKCANGEIRESYYGTCEIVQLCGKPLVAKPGIVVYTIGVTDQTIEELEILRFLGAGYGTKEYGTVKYICYGGKSLTGGHHSLFLKDGLLYGRYGTEEEVVRRADGTFVRESGSLAKQHRKDTQAQKVLDFLGSEYSMRYDAAFEFIQYGKQDVVPRGYHYYIIRANRIYGIIGAIEEEVLVNRPRIDGAELPTATRSSLQYWNSEVYKLYRDKMWDIP